MQLPLLLWRRQRHETTTTTKHPTKDISQFSHHGFATICTLDQHHKETRPMEVPE
jgi:hypothetical protein